MVSFPISDFNFFRADGFVIPIAVRSYTYTYTHDYTYTVTGKINRVFTY